MWWMKHVPNGREERETARDWDPRTHEETALVGTPRTHHKRPQPTAGVWLKIVKSARATSVTEQQLVQVFQKMFFEV